MPSTSMSSFSTTYDLTRVVMLELRTGRLLLGTRPYLSAPKWMRAGSYATDPVFAELRAHDGAMAELRRSMRHISTTLYTIMDNRDLSNAVVLETVMREVEARKIVAVFAPTVTESSQDVSMLTLTELMKSAQLQETRQGVMDNLKKILPLVPAQAQVAGGDRAKREMEQFFAPEHLEMTCGVFALWAASSGTRDGFMIDAGMLSLAITFSGKPALEAFNNMAAFFQILEKDKPDEDTQKTAAFKLASAFIYLGLSTMKLILRKVAARKGSSTSAGGGDSGGKASSFATRARTGPPAVAPAPANPSGGVKKGSGAAAAPKVKKVKKKASAQPPKKREMPEWLKARLGEGNDFNKAQAPKYKHNEVLLEKPVKKAKAKKEPGYPRVDSYDPDKDEIVSRKHTQLAAIEESTAIGYISEFAKKYPPGMVIADVPSQRAGSGHPNAGLAGEQLTGQMILEIPPQDNPIPQAVLDAADDAGVIIRDSDGKTYP